MTDAIVIGAGHNGLTSACYLAKAGLDVKVLEASERVGGMTSTNPVIEAAPDHLCNEGAMDVSLFRTSTVGSDLGLHGFGLREIEVDPIYAFLDAEGPSLCFWRDAEKTAREIRRFSRRDAAAYLALSNALDKAVDVAVPYMNSHPLRPAAGELVKGLARAVRHPRGLGPLGSLMSASLAEVIDESFEHPMVRGPLAAIVPFAPIEQDGTGWALIYFGLIQRFGVTRFAGGTGAITDALERCLLAAGGAVRTSAAVESLIVGGDRVAGVRLESGEELRARAVVSSANAKSTLLELLPRGTLSERLERRAGHIPTAGTGATSWQANVAFSGRLELTRHMEWRDDDVDLRVPGLCWASFEHHVEAWARCAKGLAPEPLANIALIPTAADPSQAPEGQDVLWLWTGIAPVDPHGGWESIGPTVEQTAIADAAKYIDGIEQLEIGRRVMTPPDLEKRFRAPDGNVYHVDPTSLRFGPLRPAAGFAGYRTPVPGLFLGGASCHPSAGICGVPGKLAAREVLKDLGSSNRTMATRALSSLGEWHQDHSKPPPQRVAQG